MSEVTDALRALQAGDRTIEDVTEMFRTRRWPPPPQRTATTAEKQAAQEQGDRDPDPEGSFAEVSQAFYTGIITVDEYEVLAGAAAEAMKGAADTPPEGTPEGTEDTPSEAPGSESSQVSEGASEDKTTDKGEASE